MRDASKIIGRQRWRLCQRSVGWSDTKCDPQHHDSLFHREANTLQFSIELTMAHGSFPIKVINSCYQFCLLISQ